MNLLQKIHERWNTSANLRDLIPTSRLYTGRVPKSRKTTATPTSPTAITLPFCRVFDGGDNNTARTNATNSDSYDLIFQFWTKTREEGKSILKQIKRLYDNWDATLDDSTLTEMVFDSSSSIEETKPGEIPVYQYVINFTAYVNETRVL